MQRSIEYIACFLVLILVQIFVFDKINIGDMVNAYVYIMMILILPIELNTGWLLIIAFGMGWAIDFSTGSGGLAAMCATWIAFARRRVITIISGREVLSIGGMPSILTMGVTSFWTYLIMMTLLYNMPYFLLENMTIENLGHTALRIVSSTIFTVLIIYMGHLLLIRNKKVWQ